VISVVWVVFGAVYGMNFPAFEMAYYWVFYVIIALMLAVSISLVVMFKKKKWI
jgi:Mg2+ and Co2+ transporter CorA